MTASEQAVSRTSQSQLPSLTSGAMLQCPYPLFDQMRSEGAVVWHPDLPAIGMVTAYAHVMDVLSDPETFSNDAYKEFRARGLTDSERVREVLATGFEPVTAMGQADGQLHDYHASLLQPFVSPRRLRQLEPRVRALIDEVVYALPLGEPFDVVHDFSAPIAVNVMCEFVGVPSSDREVFLKGSDGEAMLLGSLADEETLVNAAEDFVRLQRYAGAAILDRRANPRDDLISSVANTPPPDGLGESSLAQLVHTLKAAFTAGNETTRGALSAALLRLAGDPALADRLRENPADIPTFVEELLRVDTPLNMLLRRATKDTEIGGCSVSKGDVLATVFAAGNRDPEQFADPGELRVGRPHSRRHLAFGFGVHFCIGAPLARLELRIAIESILARFGSFHVDPTQPPEYAQTLWVRNLKSAAMTVTPVSTQM